MEAQVSLMGKLVDQPIRVYKREKEAKPWKGICVKSCWFARKDKCRCRCHHANHGKGHRHAGDNSNPEGVLPEPQATPFRNQITQERCSCGAKLKNQPITHYGPHSGGWKVEGFSDPQWLYIHCPNCDYDWALWKLGVPRE